MDKVAIIGIGNLFRGDDAAGLLAARKVGERLPDSVRVIESNGDLTMLLDCFRQHESVYIIDAVCVPGSTPGRPRGRRQISKIHDFDGRSQAPAQAEFLASSHAFGVLQAIALARTLGTLPRRLRVLGIEGCEFGMQEGVSRPTSKAIEKVVAIVVTEVEKGGECDA